MTAVFSGSDELEFQDVNRNGRWILMFLKGIFIMVLTIFKAKVSIKVLFAAEIFNLFMAKIIS